MRTGLPAAIAAAVALAGTAGAQHIRLTTAPESTDPVCIAPNTSPVWGFTTGTAIAVETMSWGQVRGLYR